MKQCKEKIELHLTPDQDGVRTEQYIIVQCVLYAPHEDVKHMNPRIQRTVGGEKRTDDPNWSYAIEHYTPQKKNGGDKFHGVTPQ